MPSTRDSPALGDQADRSCDNRGASWTTAPGLLSRYESAVGFVCAIGKHLPGDAQTKAERGQVGHFGAGRSKEHECGIEAATARANAPASARSRAAMLNSAPWGFHVLQPGALGRRDAGDGSDLIEDESSASPA